LNKPKYEKFIFKAAELFVDSKILDPTENTEVAEWVSSLANAVKEISNLLYNFFYV